jgi:outer membrane immunogenic protein
MRKVLLWVGVLSMLGPSVAATAKTPPPPPPIYSWNNCYVGGNIGYSWGKATTDTTIPDYPFAGVTVPGQAYSNSNNLDGVIGGGQVGCNWQPASTWLLGIEADFQWSGEKGSFQADDPFKFNLDPPAPPGSTAIGVTNIDPETGIAWFGTVRGRLGYIWNNWLFYATGGLAYGKVTYSGAGITESGNITIPRLRIGPLIIPFTQTVSFGSASKVNTGWTIGGGIEAPLFNLANWTWKVEYLYMDLGKLDLTAVASGGGIATSSTKFTDNIVRVGLNYHFWAH